MCIRDRRRGICKMVPGASTPGYNLSRYPTDRRHFFHFHRTDPTGKYDYFYHRLRRICHTCFYCKQHRLSCLLYTSYDTGTLIMEMVDLRQPVDQSNQNKLPVIWHAYASGLLYGNSHFNMQLTLNAVNQAFAQSPYLSNKQ